MENGYFAVFLHVLRKVAYNNVFLLFCRSPCQSHGP